MTVFGRFEKNVYFCMYLPEICDEGGGIYEKIYTYEAILFNGGSGVHGPFIGLFARG